MKLVNYKLQRDNLGILKLVISLTEPTALKFCTHVWNNEIVGFIDEIVCSIKFIDDTYT